jgi:hypothetical protein
LTLNVAQVSKRAAIVSTAVVEFVKIFGLTVVSLAVLGRALRSTTFGLLVYEPLRIVEGQASLAASAVILSLVLAFGAAAGAKLKAKDRPPLVAFLGMAATVTVPLLSAQVFRYVAGVSSTPDKGFGALFDFAGSIVWSMIAVVMFAVVLWRHLSTAS